MYSIRFRVGWCAAVFLHAPQGCTPQRTYQHTEIGTAHHFSAKMSAKKDANSAGVSAETGIADTIDSMVRLESKSKTTDKPSVCAGAIVGYDAETQTLAIVTSAQCEIPQKIGFGSDGNKDTCENFPVEKLDHPQFQRRSLQPQPHTDIALVRARCPLPASFQVSTVATAAYYAQNAGLVLAAFHGGGQPDSLHATAVEWEGYLEAASPEARVHAVRPLAAAVPCATAPGSPSFLRDARGKLYLTGISQGNSDCKVPTQYSWLRQHIDFLSTALAQPIGSKVSKMQMSVDPNVQPAATLAALPVETSECSQRARSEFYPFCAVQFQPRRSRFTIDLTDKERIKCSQMLASEAVNKLRGQTGIPYETACGDHWCGKSECEAQALNYAPAL